MLYLSLPLSLSLMQATYTHTKTHGEKGYIESFVSHFFSGCGLSTVTSLVAAIFLSFHLISTLGHTKSSI